MCFAQSLLNKIVCTDLLACQTGVICIRRYPRSTAIRSNPPQAAGGQVTAGLSTGLRRACVPVPSPWFETWRVIIRTMTLILSAINHRKTTLLLPEGLLIHSSFPKHARTLPGAHPQTRFVCICCTFVFRASLTVFEFCHALCRLVPLFFQYESKYDGFWCRFHPSNAANRPQACKICMF